MNNKSKVTADLKSNLLHITLVGVISAEELNTLFTEIRFCVADLQPGFNVINDMTQCRVGHLRGLGTYIKIREYLVSKQVGNVLRVVNQEQVVFNQISRAIDKLNHSSPTYVATLDEARAKLAMLAASVE